MMGRTALVTLALSALSLALTPGLAAAEKAYGKAVTLKETTSIGKILAEPDAYVGKPVRVEGQVVDVCAMAGCWMELQEVDGGAKLRVKVDDGVIVFPADSKGKVAVAEGTVEAIAMTREQYVDHQKHIADEQGRDFNPASIGDGPFKILQLRGTGATIPE